MIFIIFSLSGPQKCGVICVQESRLETKGISHSVNGISGGTFLRYTISINRFQSDFPYRAYQTALDLPISTFSPEPYLKLSGIAITLATVLEADGLPREAWDIYIQALSLPRTTNTSAADLPKNTGYASLLPEEASLSPQETLRQVSIAHKLGEMAQVYGFGEEEEEKWLTWSVERLLRVIQDKNVDVESTADGKRGERQETLLADLDLPGWVTKTNLGAPLEALGAFYARKGNVE